MKRYDAVLLCLLLSSCTSVQSEEYVQSEPVDPMIAGVAAGSADVLEQTVDTEAESTAVTTQQSDADVDFSIDIVDSSKDIYDREYMLSRFNSDPLVFEGRMFYGEPVLTGFTDVMGCDGVAVRTALAPYGSGSDTYENYLDYFCVDMNGRIVCIAETFGWRNCGEYDKMHFSADLDGDGVCEFITNNTYGADGVPEIRVYKMKDGVPYVGIYSYEPQHSGNIFRKYTEYNGDTGMVKISAETYGRDKKGNQTDTGFVTEERLLSIDDLVFTEYKK